MLPVIIKSYSSTGNFLFKEGEFNLKDSENPKEHFIDGRTADIYLGDEIIGNLGEIHPKILKNWKIKMPVVLFELSLERIFNLL